MNISSAGSDASYMPGAGPSAVGNLSAANRGSVNDSNVTVLEVKKQLKPLSQAEGLVFAAFLECCPGFGHTVQFEPVHLCFNLVHKI